MAAAVAAQIYDESQALPPAAASADASSASAARPYLAATLDGKLSVKVAESIGLHVWHVEVTDELAASSRK